MFDIEKIVRPNILKLKPYSSARHEFEGRSGIFLDANENPYGIHNRYPDPTQIEVRTLISKKKNIAIENICLGNGSDEVIDLAVRIFCEPQKDKVIICPPTYGMYEVVAAINELEVIHIPLLNGFQPDVSKIFATEAKMLFLCSPNNPTGNCLNGIEQIIQNFKGIVFVDEAYIDFCKEKSLIQLIHTYPNLIISQTFSKAYGLAGIRIGAAFANTKIIDLFYKIKPPYNINELSQNQLIKSLSDYKIFEENLENILVQKTRLIAALKDVEMVKCIYPSDANFILLEVIDADDLYQFLLTHNVIIRNRNSVIPNCIRITIGNEDEITQLINAIKLYG